MSEIERKCLICDSIGLVKWWGEDSTCKTCGQKYEFDEGVNMQVTDEQIQVLRAHYEVGHDVGYLQYQIDNLMLEYCPDQMTEEQIKN